MLISFRTIGSLLEPLASAGPGEIEVLSYGERARVLAAQPFTTDSRQAAQAMAYRKISTGLQSPTSDMFDAIAQATSDLETRPSDRRRIVVVIGEDSKSSENGAKLKDAIDQAARSKVAIFFVAP